MGLTLDFRPICIEFETKSTLGDGITRAKLNVRRKEVRQLTSQVVSMFFAMVGGCLTLAAYRAGCGRDVPG